MNFVFLMDPLNTVVMEKDTSFIFMLEASRRNHKIYYLADGGILAKNGKIGFHVTEVIPQKDSQNPFIEKQNLYLPETEVDIIFIRNDPPFDQQYLFNTWILERLNKKIPIINNPNGIRTVNEKLWATQFTSIIPHTLVGRQIEDLFTFLKEEKEIIAKPTDSFGGQSVFKIDHHDSNAGVIFETLTHNGTRDIILQQYVKAASKGDKRVLLLDGQPLGALLRVHKSGEHRNNFFSGGKPQSCELTANDLKIIEILKPKLKKLGLYFVGIDIIGDKLIEVNVTSPTCLQEMNTLYNAALEKDVIDFAENLIKQN
ncbi:MAG: glutathione synthase [Candidatus Omnitrophica bacterium]|nr:glutathione synthase [Candidatus Omnitrophota bacterium]